MKFTIPIIPEVTLENSEILFRHHYGGIIRGCYFWMVPCLVAAAIGYALPFPASVSIFIAAVGLAAAFVLIFYAIWIGIQKKKYMEETKKVYSDPGEMTIELTDEHFAYSDHLQQSKTTWGLFDSFTISQGVLFLNSKNGTGCMISKRVTRETDFESIVAFVTEKISVEAARK